MKKRLRQHGPYGEHLSAAREVLKFHEDEAKKVKKYIQKALAELQDDILVYTSDEDGYEPVIKKRQRNEDQVMKKE